MCLLRMSLWPRKQMHKQDEFSLNLTALFLFMKSSSFLQTLGLNSYNRNVECSSEMLLSKIEEVLILDFFIGDILVNPKSDSTNANQLHQLKQNAQPEPKASVLNY